MLQVIFIGRSYFGDNGSQNYLIFQLVFKCFTPPTGGDRILLWKCKGLSEERVKLPDTLDRSLVPQLTFFIMQK